jgi:hypothetical protein
LAQTIRKTQLALIESDWKKLDECHKEGLRQALSEAAKAHPDTVGCSPNFARLVAMCSGHPWQMEDISLILKDQVTSTNLKKAEALADGEDMGVLVGRLRLLMKYNVLQPAFNMTRFLFKHHNRPVQYRNEAQSEYAELLATHLLLTSIFKDLSHLATVVNQISLKGSSTIDITY